MKVLITGATGLVGMHIAQLYMDKGAVVHYLTTRKSALKKSKDNFKGFLWNVDDKYIDPDCLDGVDTIIHLAGETVFQRWNKKVKQRILDSRIDSTQLLIDLLNSHTHQVEQVIVASAIGIYPDNLQATNYKENEVVQDPDNFLAQVCVAWEQRAQLFKKIGVKLSIVRIGIVLSDKGGALVKMAQPVRYYVGSSFGSGKMWQSWIAIDDLAGIFYHIASHRLDGVFNGVAPSPVSSESMVDAIGEQLGKPVFLPNIPAFVMKLMLGEMSSIVLSSQHVSSESIEAAGYEFQFPQLEKALNKYL